METLNNLAWYWQFAVIIAWVLTCLVLFLVGIDSHSPAPAILSGVLFFGALGWLVAWSWLDDTAPRGRCEAAGGIVVVTPAQGRACIDKSAVVPPDDWH